MEDVLTEIPPPSRFFLEDLNNFSQPPTLLPSPFLLFTTPNSNKPLRPSLLVIALSSPSLHFFHHVSSKTLIGALILPEIPVSGNSIEPSMKDKSCNIFALDHADKSIIIASMQYPVAADRSHAVAQLLIGEQIIPERLLILDSVQGRNFRGRLSADDAFALKLETSSERGGSPLLQGLNYFPTGSVVDGLAAALLGRCQMKNIRGTLCVSWPDFGGPVSKLIKSLLLKDVVPGLEHSIDNNMDEGYRFGRSKDHHLDLDLYT